MKRCPNCESIHVCITDSDRVGCLACGMSGPYNDHDGAKWDSLPRWERIAALEAENRRLRDFIKHSDDELQGMLL